MGLLSNDLSKGNPAGIEGVKTLILLLFKEINKLVFSIKNKKVMTRGPLGPWIAHLNLMMYWPVAKEI